MNESLNYDIKVGFARLDVTPPLGVSINGYMETRYASGILDPIEINAVAFEKDGMTAVYIGLDVLYFPTDYCLEAIDAVAEATGLPKDAIFLQGTHTHTSPMLGTEKELTRDIDKEYSKLIKRKLGDAARLAMNDLTPAAMGYAKTKAEHIAFNRRYLMTDGTTETNPGVNNPRIKASAGLLDEEAGVIRFLREDGENIVLVNFANHPDVIGSDKLSADWPGLTRRVFERAMPNTRCVVINGAQGDINHINVNASPHELRNMIIDFDSVPRGYAHSVHIANVLAGAVMGVYEKVNFKAVDSFTYKVKRIEIPTNMPKPEELPQARYINEMYNSGRIGELPYEGMMVTTVVAEARRMLRLEHGPESLLMPLSALKLGGVVILGIPGEPFTGIGLGIKATEGYDMICPACILNGSYGYFPLQDSYDEGGYEARSSRFKAGVAELIIKEGKSLLEELK